MDKALKILLLGDYSNCHVSLAKGLRDLGHEVTVASDGSGWQRTERDIDISRPFSGKIGGALQYIRFRWDLRKKLSGYDVVSLHNPLFAHLRPERTRPIFDSLFDDNRSVFLTAMGSDTNFIQECLDPNSLLKYNEWRIGSEAAPLQKAFPEKVGEWTSAPMVAYHDYFYSRIHGATPILYEYDVALRRKLPREKIGYIGLPIYLPDLNPVEIDKRNGKINIFLGRHANRLIEKGTDILEEAARRVVEKHPDRAELTIVENRPYDEYIKLLRSADIVLDQLYSYTPATNALLAMAYGQCAVSGGEPEFYDFIGETENRPGINAVPDLDRLTEDLERIVLQPEKLPGRGQASRRFVEKYNDAVDVARRAVDFWTKRMDDLGL